MWKRTKLKLCLVEEASAMPWLLKVYSRFRFATVSQGFFIQSLLFRELWESMKNSVFCCWEICENLEIPQDSIEPPPPPPPPPTSAPWMPDSDTLGRCQATKEIVWYRQGLDLTMAGQKHSECSLPTKTSSEFHFCDITPGSHVILESLYFFYNLIVHL